MVSACCQRGKACDSWASQEQHQHRFSAFWLRSSVVSVLISLISDTSLIWGPYIKLIFGAGRWNRGLLRPLHVSARYCSISGNGAPPLYWGHSQTSKTALPQITLLSGFPKPTLAHRARSPAASHTHTAFGFSLSGPDPLLLHRNRLSPTRFISLWIVQCLFPLFS